MTVDPSVHRLRRPVACLNETVCFLDHLPRLFMLMGNGLYNLCHGGVRCVSALFEKEVEYLAIGAEKGVAVFVDEIAVRGNADCAFLFGERLWCLVFAVVEGKGGGEDMRLVERGTFGMPLAVLVEEEKQFGFASEEFAAPFPRWNVTNRANDVVVGFHKRGEDKTAILIVS